MTSCAMSWQQVPFPVRPRIGSVELPARRAGAVQRRAQPVPISHRRTRPPRRLDADVPRNGHRPRNPREKLELRLVSRSGTAATSRGCRPAADADRGPGEPPRETSTGVPITRSQNIECGASWHRDGDDPHGGRRGPGPHRVARHGLPGRRPAPCHAHDGAAAEQGQWQRASGGDLCRAGRPALGTDRRPARPPGGPSAWQARILGTGGSGHRHLRHRRSSGHHAHLVAAVGMHRHCGARSPGRESDRNHGRHRRLGQYPRSYHRPAPGPRG